MTANSLAYSRRVQVVAAGVVAATVGLCVLGARAAVQSRLMFSQATPASAAIAPTTELKAAQTPFRLGPETFTSQGRFYFGPPKAALVDRNLAKSADKSFALSDVKSGGKPLVTALSVPMPAARPQIAEPAQAVPLPQARPKQDDDPFALLAATSDATTAVYVVASGAFVMPNGKVLQGGSGTANTHNNPAMQSARNGPIPEGLWTTGPSQSMISTFANGTQHRETGIFLTPTSGVQTFGRDATLNRFGQREAFAIHPDNSRGKLTNIGCISFLASDAAEVFAARDAGVFDKILVVGYAPNAATPVASRQKPFRDAALR